MLDLVTDCAALLIVAFFGYNCFKRVQRIIKTNANEICKPDNRVQPHDD